MACDSSLCEWHGIGVIPALKLGSQYGEIAVSASGGLYELIIWFIPFGGGIGRIGMLTVADMRARVTMSRVRRCMVIICCVDWLCFFIVVISKVG